MKNWRSIAAVACSLFFSAFVGNALAADATYTYDALGRITSVVYSNGHSITYTYDAAGNRITVSRT